MKMLSFALLSVALVLAACSKSNNGPVDGSVVGLALPAECAGPVDSYGANWTDYQSAGVSAYNWNGNHHFRHGGCPRGTFAACGNGVGMICVPEEIAYDHQVAWFNYHDGANRLSFCGYEGANNAGACSYRSMDGAGQIGRACIVGQPADCGGGVCAPIASASREAGGRRHRHASAIGVGVCVQ